MKLWEKLTRRVTPQYKTVWRVTVHLRNNQRWGMTVPNKEEMERLFISISDRAGNKQMFTCVDVSFWLEDVQAVHMNPYQTEEPTV